MKKVIGFLLTLTIALGGLGFAHAAVYASQDDLAIYPTLELGDPTILHGLTANLTFTCGNHLRWHTSHTFGGETATEFVYDRQGTQEPVYFTRNGLTIGLCQGMSASSDGGFPVTNAAYSRMIREVVAETPTGGSTSKEFVLSDYLDYYRIDYDLFYEDAERYSSEGFDLASQMLGDSHYTGHGAYSDLRAAFRFPVQPGNTAVITTGKDDAGRLSSLAYDPKNSPELHFISDVNADGIWFVPIFRDIDGDPLPYESPAGHGIYFIPWTQSDIIYYTKGTTMAVLTPDVDRAQRLVPLDEALNILHMQIDADAGEAWMLTREGDRYILTAFDLTTGRTLAVLELMTLPGESVHGYFFTDEGYLLAVLGKHIALVDTASRTLLLTAPDAADQTFGARSYNNDIGTIRFDGRTLILSDAAHYREGSFWTAAWRQDELVYYGEYDCSLMRGNDDWYYSSISAEAYPITLK